MNLAPDNQRFPGTWGTETIEAIRLPQELEWRVTIRTTCGVASITLDEADAKALGRLLTGGDAR